MEPTDDGAPGRGTARRVLPWVLLLALVLGAAAVLTAVAVSRPADRDVGGVVVVSPSPPGPTSSPTGSPDPSPDASPGRSPDPSGEPSADPSPTGNGGRVAPVPPADDDDGDDGDGDDDGGDDNDDRDDDADDGDD